LYFVKGEVRDNSTLEKANIQKAKTVVLLAEDNSVSSDEKTLLRALAIARYSRKKAFKREKENKTIARKMDYETFKTDADNDKLYVIAEINDTQFKKDLLESDVNEVIVTGSYSKNIITQSMMNFGVSKVIDEILQYNEYNEFYVIDLANEKYKHLRGYTFDELLLPLRQQGILLVAIKVVYHDENLEMIIDAHKIEALLEEEGLKREVIINPITKTEIERKTDADDHLIVFSTDRKTLERRIIEVEI
jgi:Trk K+ transport system NAD-binding subunit